MNLRRFTILVLAVAPAASLLVAGCSGTGDTRTDTGGTEAVSTAIVSVQCTDAMETMRLGYEKLGDFTNEQADEANALELGPLNACDTADEWVAAARANPSAVGLTSSAFVKPGDELGVRCHMDIPGTKDTPVCADAMTTGVVN